jgi:hypothetical protein
MPAQSMTPFLHSFVLPFSLSYVALSSQPASTSPGKVISNSTAKQLPPPMTHHQERWHRIGPTEQKTTCPHSAEN